MVHLIRVIRVGCSLCQYLGLSVSEILTELYLIKITLLIWIVIQMQLNFNEPTSR